MQSILSQYTKTKILELLAAVGDQTHESSWTQAKLVAQLSDYSVAQVFGHFSVKDLNAVLKSFNLMTTGKKEIKIDRLAEYLEDADEVTVVTGSTGNRYTVKVKDGVYTCTCAGFEYGVGDACKHIPTSRPFKDKKRSKKKGVLDLDAEIANMESEREAERKRKEERCKDLLISVFEQNENLKSISWEQYSLYFNDGDACPFEFQGLCKLKYKRKIYDYFEIESGEIKDADLVKTCSDIHQILEYHESILEGLFGNHTIVTATYSRGKLRFTEEYNTKHD